MNKFSCRDERKHRDSEASDTSQTAETSDVTSNPLKGGDSMRLMTEAMTVLQYERCETSPCSLAANDLSASLPNLTGSHDLGEVCIAGNEVRNVKDLTDGRVSLSGTADKLHFKTQSLEDCPSCINHSWMSNGYASVSCTGSNPNLSGQQCINNGILSQCEESEDLPLTITSTNNRLSAVLENISLVYLPQTKQLVPSVKAQACAQHGSNNNNVPLGMVRTGPEGAEEPSEPSKPPTPCDKSVKHFPRLEASLDSGPSPAFSTSRDLESALATPEFGTHGAVLSQESDVSTLSHSTVVPCDDTNATDTGLENEPLNAVEDIHSKNDSKNSPNAHSGADGSSFSSISSLSTGTELSVASCSDAEPTEKVILDSDEAGFVEISLDAKGICDPKLVRDGVHTIQEPRAQLRFPTHTLSGAKPKKKGLGSFLTRNIFSRKAKEASADASPLGWRLFGKVPPKTSPSKETPDILDPPQCSDPCSDVPVPGPLQPSLYHPGARVKKTDVEAPSTTALILEQRPRGLPSKDPEEEERHRQQYDAMVEASKRKEMKEAKKKKVPTATLR